MGVLPQPTLRHPQAAAGVAAVPVAPTATVLWRAMGRITQQTLVPVVAVAAVMVAEVMALGLPAVIILKDLAAERQPRLLLGVTAEAAAAAAASQTLKKPALVAALA
jgi:hypothetical protein